MSLLWKIEVRLLDYAALRNSSCCTERSLEPKSEVFLKFDLPNDLIATPNAAARATSNLP